MCPRLFRPFLGFLTLTLLPSALLATKLVEVRPVDEEILMVYLKDGEVFYRDDGTGPSAFVGHDYAPGDDRLVAYGDPLNTEAATQPAAWVLSSADDTRYGNAGAPPAAVHRKAKAVNTDGNWNHRLDHWVFLRLPHALKPGTRYTLTVDARTGADRTRVDFTYDLASSVSEAIHVNLLGFAPRSVVKTADLYLWLGDGGPRDYAKFEGRRAWLHDVATGEAFPAGPVTFWKPNVEEDEWHRRLTGSPVWTVDFSAFSRPGRYRVVIDGVGASSEFAIRDDHWFEPYRTSLRGYYYMRIGEPRTANHPPPRQPRFIPGEDPAGFTIYLTDLDPFDPEWKDFKGDTWDEPHFKPAAKSMFWQRRLPGHPTNPHGRGGHSDALDWDRHLGHVSDLYDILLPYLLSGGRLHDDNLGLAESGNGLPDLIDEARNEVDFFLSIRDGEAYAHGLTNPTREKSIMFQAGPTTMAAWANAANCAMLADALRVAGQPELMARYRDEAIKAYRFAERQPVSQLDDKQEVGDMWMRGRDFRMMAAAFLYNVTGDRAWEDAMAADAVGRTGVVDIQRKEHWEQLWGTAAYLLTPHPQHHPELAAHMRAAIRRQAEANNLRHMDVRPSRRSSSNHYWQTAANLQLVVLAHRFSDDPAERARCERAMVLEADWTLGRNPMNTVEMTGLGSRRIENCYTAGRNDGAPGLHPGHTPYNNLDPWNSDNGSNPRWFTDRGYPAWEKGWPHQEAYFNSRYCWANGEFTPRQTMRGKMVLYAYLFAITARAE